MRVDKLHSLVPLTRALELTARTRPASTQKARKPMEFISEHGRPVLVQRADAARRHLIAVKIYIRHRSTNDLCTDDCWVGSTRSYWAPAGPIQ